MKKVFKNIIAFSLPLFSLATACLAISASIALFAKAAESKGSSGEISLRSYYECGSGTELDPFVITRPRHLYNLSRLQALGVYGEKTYFQLGKVDLNNINSNNVPMCYVDESDVQKPYLDMTNSTYFKNPINAIGSEALPFYGVFDGNNCEIKNLNVYASPEDAGLFGYTAHDSIVKNLFLTDVTIHANGYTSEFANLYGPSSTLAVGAGFTYTPYKTDVVDEQEVVVVDTTNIIDFDKESSDSATTRYYITYTGANDEPVFVYNPDHANGSIPPTISAVKPNNSYYPILSGDLIKLDNSGNIVPDLTQIFKFFGDHRPAAGTPGIDDYYPIQASSIASLVYYSIDDYGLKHSKVVMTLEFDFTLQSKNADCITMDVHVGKEHTNNIGLVIGHCDGTATDLYVCGGKFDLNNGGDSYNKVANGSNLGLIGLVGGTIQNNIANKADASIGEGKEIGVLDFTTVYKDIINSSSFPTPTQTYSSGEGGIAYNPISTSKYLSYLRMDNSSPTTYKYITKRNNTVSFKGREVITNQDLGVFTVATDAGSDGMDNNAGQYLEKSIVTSEDVSIGGDYYVYYATGEYNRDFYDTYKITYDTYRKNFNTDNPEQMLPGYHFPDKRQMTKESFDIREQRQNYIVRFKLDPKYRKTNGFYFSDVDTETDGGKFMGNYFNYKLVDQNNVNIANDRPECGVMLKDSRNLEIQSFSASFGTPNHSSGSSFSQTFTYGEEGKEKEYVSNMINFEIFEPANVTVVAAPVTRTDAGKTAGQEGAVLGVYRIDSIAGGDDVDDIVNGEYHRQYNKPDYAFFMPNDDHLAYFDYYVDNNKKGKIGVWDDENEEYVEATYETNATMPKNYKKANSGYSEHGYVAGKQRLFAHTFYLKPGRYCLGSASGPNSGTANETTCKIYYICAQGQEEGQLGFKDNVFSGSDIVDDIDFIKSPRFNENGTENIFLKAVSKYDPTTDSLDIEEKAISHYLKNQRCYVVLVNSDRSLFASDKVGDLTFAYVEGEEGDPNMFMITTTHIDAILHLAANNYLPDIDEEDETKDFIVSLLGREGRVTDPVIVYSPA